MVCVPCRQTRPASRPQAERPAGSGKRPKPGPGSHGGPTGTHIPPSSKVRQSSYNQCDQSMHVHLH